MRSFTMIGIDPSITATGLGVYDSQLGPRTNHDPRNIITYTLRSDPHLYHGDPKRWDQILNQVYPFFDRHDGDALAIVEDLYPSKKSRVQGSIASLRSVLIHGLSVRDVPVVTVNPMTLKVYAVGNSRAQKKEVLAAARLRYGHLLTIDNHNEADALTLLAMGFDHYGWPLVEVEAWYRRALKAPKWPDISLPKDWNWIKP